MATRRSKFARVPFDHPLWVLYSSGTTGLPKAIVQGQGGILLEHLKKLHLHVDAHPGDRLFWFTTTGWMMWNFLVSGLLTRAAIVLYDGNPGHPDMGVLWDLAERAGVTMFGTSASYIAACMKAGVEPGAGRDLSRLKAVGSTGSPLSPEGFDWVYRHLGADTWLFSTSGGTDLCTAFVGGTPLLPVYRGELQARALGAAVEAWDEDGRPVIDEVGELVVTEPMPSMPVYLWGDEDGSRYRASYFEHFPGIWRHGDWIEITSRGTAVIYGRSDSTINRSGVRMGTSEIYRAVLGVEDILDALVVDVPRHGTDGWMPLFVVLREGAGLDDDLRREIARRVRENCSPRHVPDEVFQIAEVPRTLSGKALEVPVKRILMGTPPAKAASRDSLAEPRRARLVRRAGEVARKQRLTARYGVRRRRVTAPSARRSTVAPAMTATSRAPREPSEPCRRHVVQRLVGVAQGHGVGDHLQHADHLVACDEEPAEEQLWEDDRRHELHRLKLGPGEGADEQPQRHAEQRIADGKRDHGGGRAGHLETQWPEGDRGRDQRLQRADQGEGHPVAEEQVELCQRQRHQPLQRPGRALPQHGDRGDDEHRAEGEEPHQRPAHLLEGREILVEGAAQQGEQEG